LKATKKTKSKTNLLYNYKLCNVNPVNLVNRQYFSIGIGASDYLSQTIV